MLRLKLCLFFLTVAFFVYCGLIETQWIEITTHQLIVPIEDDLTIIQLSDLHTKGLGLFEKKIIKYIKQIAPDVIVLTGDISSPGGTAQAYYEVLSQLKAPRGVYFVSGNWEHWESLELFNHFLTKANIVDLNNKNKKLDKNLWLVGLDDALAGDPRPDLAFNQVPKEAYKIGIFHSPTHFDSTFKNLNLALSGHTHGGQMRLPFLPPLWLPEGSVGYVSGWFYKGNSRMYVSRGLGTSILPFRLFCRPEIVVLKLRKNKEA